jgi:threonine/homoserine/homoserine lactone efflux protein
MMHGWVSISNRFSSFSGHPMLGTQNLSLFIIAGLLLNFTPGPDSLFVISRSASGGMRAGAVAALGIGCGVFVHVFAAALGLSALLATSATAFTVLKLLGAAYLLYVGIGMLRSKAKSETTETSDAATDGNPSAPPAHAKAISYHRIFLQGFLTNVLNPKVAIFFLAFVPQFIAPDAGNKPLAFIVLGCIFNINGMLWCHLLAFVTAFASHRIRVGKTLILWLNRLLGAMFVSFGLKLALADH